MVLDGLSEFLESIAALVTWIKWIPQAAWSTELYQAKTITTQRRLEQEDAADAQANSNGYYGYGYYNAYGEWVTPYKTMFQIQYFNVVLWTSLGLCLIILNMV